MQPRQAAGAVVGAIALAIAAGAAGAPGRATGTLQLDASFSIKITRAACPPDAATTTECYENSGAGVVPGLGAASIRFALLYATDPVNDACRYWSAPSITLSVAGKGELHARAANPTCRPPGASTTMAATLTGGTGTYQGATGSGEIHTSGSIETGGGRVTWTGTVTVPGVDFDVTPPVLSGARSKLVRVPKRAKRVRVRYTVTAADAVDGEVAPTCRPASGSLSGSGARA